MTEKAPYKFAGKVGEHSSRVSGFDRKATGSVVHLTGFYLFTAFQALRERLEGADPQLIRWAA